MRLKLEDVCFMNKSCMCLLSHCALGTFAMGLQVLYACNLRSLKLFIYHVVTFTCPPAIRVTLEANYFSVISAIHTFHSTLLYVMSQSALDRGTYALFVCLQCGVPISKTKRFGGTRPSTSSWRLGRIDSTN